jgi:hypothetical protein
MKNIKILGKKAYGHIPHLPESRMGPGDHKCSEGQAIIATIKARDKHDLITVTEKLDGSCCAVTKKDNKLYPLTRAGYLANTSSFEQHHMFYNWVFKNMNRFNELLKDDERVCGEWLAESHGTRYLLPHEPFVVFDIFDNKNNRIIYNEVSDRLRPLDFIQPMLLSIGDPLSIERAMELVSVSGHGALDPVEGAVWRVERNELIDRHKSERKWKVDFLVKYVRPDKVDGLYLPEQSGKEPIWNWRP